MYKWLKVRGVKYSIVGKKTYQCTPIKPKKLLTVTCKQLKFVCFSVVFLDFWLVFLLVIGLFTFLKLTVTIETGFSVDLDFFGLSVWILYHPFSDVKMLLKKGFWKSLR
jgi:hypothetical protein